MKKVLITTIILMIFFSLTAQKVFYPDPKGKAQYFEKTGEKNGWPVVKFEGGKPMYLNGTMGLVFKAEVPQRIHGEFLKKHGLEVIYHDETDPGYYLTKMKKGAKPFRLSVKLFNSGLLKWAQPDFRTHFEIATDADAIDDADVLIDTDPEAPDTDMASPEPVEPDDTWYSQYTVGRWHHEKIYSNLAWALEQGDPQIKIAIVDNGVDLEHEDLVDNLLPDLGWNFVDENSDASYKFHTGTTAYASRIMAAHGTSVAGIAAAKGNNGKGIAGICWDCGIIPIRFIDTDVGTGYVDTFHKAYLALKWAVDKGASVVNNSWVWWNQSTCGTVPFNSYVEQAVQYALKNGRDGKGTLMVWAAGNNFCDTAKVKNFDNEHIVVVSALRHNTLDDLKGYKSIYSNYGDAIDVIAPAGDPDDSPPYSGIVATDISMGLGGDAGNYATNPSFTGTSAAAPVVSGAIGLMLSAKPEMKFFEALHCLKKAAAAGVAQRIADGDMVDDHNIIDKDRQVVGQCEWKDIKDTYFGVTMQHNNCFGYGYLDVYEMVRMALNDECTYEQELCESDEDCPEDQFCDTETGLCILEVGCKTDEDCLTYQKCDVESGLCYFVDEEPEDEVDDSDVSDTSDNQSDLSDESEVSDKDQSDQSDESEMSDMTEEVNDDAVIEDEVVGCGCTIVGGEW